MIRSIVHAKIHRATVTGADLDYVGSITIDEDVLDAAGIWPYEKVQVVDVTNGARLETYAIVGPRGSGTIQLNGAAAHLVDVGDLVIIMAYAQVDTRQEGWEPTVVFVDSQNAISEVRTLAPAGGR